MSDAQKPTSVQEAREQLLLGAEASLRQEYGDSPRHPSTQRRYDRDWAVWVEEIDALIAAVRAEERARARQVANDVLGKQSERMAEQP